MEESRLLPVNDEPVGHDRVTVVGGMLSSFVFLCIVLFVCNANSVLLGLVSGLFPSDLSFVASNALIGSPLLVTAVLSIPSSMMARKFGARFVVVGLASVCGLALFGIGVTLRLSSAPSYAALFVCGALVGAGGAILNAGSSAIMSWVPERRHGIALGMFFFSYGLGPPVLGAYAAAFANAVGLSSLFMLQGGLCFLSSLLCALVVRDSPFLQLRRSLRKLDDSAIEAICRERFGQDFFPGVDTDSTSRWRALVSIKCWILSLVREASFFFVLINFFFFFFC